MSEMAKSMIFVATALVAMIAAFATRPRTEELEVQSLVGKNLTKGFNDPDAAKRLRIVRFNEDTAVLSEFDVAEVDGLWTIPSKDGYPADAERQMAEVATSLLDREILQVVSSSAADHEQYGVVDPLSPKLVAGQKGVGTRVEVSDVHGEKLVDLIVGQAVKDAPKQRYVRDADRDAVYVVEIDPTKLSTNFADWIEKDLLKLNPWDLQKVEIHDYSAEFYRVLTNQGLATQVNWLPRTEMTLGYDDQKAKWSPIRLRKFDPDSKEYVNFELTDDEVLNDEKLNAMKGALDDLRIVDVAQKPEGLSGNLKAGESFLNNAEAQADLEERGFGAVAFDGGERDDIISTEGEVICTMKDGAEYVLRFGALQLDENGGGKSSEDEEAASTKSDEGVHRYLFVMARFNEQAVAKPELQELPALPEGASDEEETASTSDDANEATGDESEAKGEDTAAAGEESEAKGEDASAAESDDQLKALIAERERIEKENRRKLDEYEATLKRGREQVQELNDRFGDWYYVVDDSTVGKIRLGRDDVIKQKDKEQDGESASADGDASQFGTPGQAIPGLPSLPGTGS